jgi:hypothetical protein
VHDSLALGIALGYPQCCIDFFLKHEKEKAQSDNDFADRVALASEPGRYPYAVNILGRYTDCCIISHFPCSFGCRSSQDISRKFADALAAGSPEMLVIMKAGMRGTFRLAGKEFLFA